MTRLIYIDVNGNEYPIGFSGVRVKSVHELRILLDLIGAGDNDFVSVRIINGVACLIPSNDARDDEDVVKVLPTKDGGFTFEGCGG